MFAVWDRVEFKWSNIGCAEGVGQRRNTAEGQRKKGGQKKGFT